MAPVRLSNPRLSHPLVLCSVNNVFSQLCNSWDHLQHLACVSQGPCLVTGYFVQCTCTSFSMKALAAAALELHWSDITAVLYEVVSWLCYSYGYVMIVAMAAVLARREAVLWPLCQTGNNKLFALPMTLWLFFQPLSSCFTYPEFKTDTKYCITLLTDLHCHVAS